MVKARRVSIGTLCVVVAVAALDLAWWRHIAHYWLGSRSLLGFRGPALDAGAMPMASVLVIGLSYVLSNRGRVPRAFAGFLWGGAAGLLLYLVYCWVCWRLPQWVVSKSHQPIYTARAWWPWLDTPYGHYLYYADIVYFGTPQFLLALCCGLICRKNQDL